MEYQGINGMLTYSKDALFDISLSGVSPIKWESKFAIKLAMGICTCFASCSLEGTGFNVTMATCPFVRPHGDGAKDLKEMVLSLTGSVDRSEFLGKASTRSLMRSSLETSGGIFEIRKVRAMMLECFI